MTGCDCIMPRTEPCPAKVTMVRMCMRCAHEPDDAFHSSDEHVELVNVKHWRVRGRPPQWRRTDVD